MSAAYPYLSVIVITMVAAFVLTDLLKRLFGVLSWPKSPKLGDFLLKAFAVAVGALAGFLLGAADPTVGGWPVGLLVGVGSGGLCTWGVKQFKQWVERQRVQAVREVVGPVRPADPPDRGAA